MMPRLVILFFLGLLGLTPVQASTGERKAAGASPSTNPSTRTAAQLQAMAPRMVFQILVSELAVQEGQLALAAATYGALAEETGQANVAERATKLALSARSGPQALKAARIWLAAAPNEEEAQDTVDALEVLLGQREELVASLIKRREQARKDKKLEAFYDRLSGLASRSPDKLAGLQLLEAVAQPDLSVSSVLYSRAMLNEQAGRPQEMETLLRQLIAKDPKHAHALNALGYSLADRGERLQEANDLIKAAVALSPNDAHILDSMGWVLFRQGKLTQARKWLQKAHAKQPDAEISAHLGEVLWIMGETDQALAAWRRGLSNDPHNKVLFKTLERLAIPLDRLAPSIPRGQ